MPGDRSRAVGGALVVALVAGALFGWRLGAYALFDPDEARHAEVAREMLTGTGGARFFLPTLELEPYREKPAGWYWLAALAMATFGATEGAARLASAVAALVAVLAVYRYAAPREGPRGAAAAALVAATSVGWFGLARLATLDMTLTACVVVGVLAGLAWLDAPAPRPAPLAPWVAAALGTLVKGPVAFVLVGAPLAVAAAVASRRPTWGELRAGRGAAVAAAIVAVLYVPMALLDASYLSAFTATNLRRFAADSPHAAPPWVYLVWIPLLALPWAAVGTGALVAAARDPARRPLVLWAATVALVLAVPRGKLPTYALSAVAPLALVIGPALARPGAGDAGPVRAGAGLLAAVAAAAGVAAPFVAPDYPVGGWGRAALALTLLATAGTVAWALVARPARVPALLLAATLILEPLVLRVVVPAVARLHSDRETAAVVRRAERAPVIAFAARMPSLVFYLEEPVIRTDDLDVVRDLWRHDGLAFLATGRKHFAAIETALGDRAYVWHATPRRRLYANRPPPGA